MFVRCGQFFLHARRQRLTHIRHPEVAPPPLSLPRLRARVGWGSKGDGRIDGRASFKGRVERGHLRTTGLTQYMLLLIVAAIVVFSAQAPADSWPSKPIRVIIPFSAGSATD